MDGIARGPSSDEVEEPGERARERSVRVHRRAGGETREAVSSLRRQLTPLHHAWAASTDLLHGWLVVVLWRGAATRRHW